MSGIEAARKCVAEGCLRLRVRKDSIPGDYVYDVKGPFEGRSSGWFLLDSFSASAIVQVYDALNETNRAKYERLSIPSMAKLAFKFVRVGQ